MATRKSVAKIHGIVTILFGLVLSMGAFIHKGTADEVKLIAQEVKLNTAAREQQVGAQVVERLGKVEAKTEAILRTVDRIANKLDVTPAAVVEPDGHKGG